MALVSNSSSQSPRTRTRFKTTYRTRRHHRVLQKRLQLIHSPLKILQQLICPRQGSHRRSPLSPTHLIHSKANAHLRLEPRKPRTFDDPSHLRQEHTPQILHKRLHHHPLLLLDPHHNMDLVNDIFHLLEQISLRINIQQRVLRRLGRRRVTTSVDLAVLSRREMRINKELVEGCRLLVCCSPDGVGKELDEIGLPRGGAARAIEEDAAAGVDYKEGEVVC